VRREALDLDTAPCRDQSELGRRIEGVADKDGIMELTVSGDAEFSFDAAVVEELLSDRFFYLKVVDETRAYSGRWVEKFRNERTVRGIFVRKLVDKIENARTDDEKKLLDMALRYGLTELAGEDAD
jgi:hypothetical protein